MRMILHERAPHSVAIAFGMLALSMSLPAGAWDPVRDLTGKNINNLIKDRVDNLGRQIEKAVDDPVDYVTGLPQSIFNDICSAPVQLYRGTLRGRASDEWRRLPGPLVTALQPYYSVDLTRIKYASVGGLPGNNAMTFGTEIYFPRNINLRDWGDLLWMTHEMEHVIQYARSRSDAQKICEYQAKAIGNAGQHDNIDMERAADRKAESVVAIAYQAMNAPPSGLRGGDLSRGPPPLPSTPAFFGGAEPNSIMISNETFQEVYFGLRTRTYPGGWAALPPRSRQIFYGNPVDRDFEISITTNGYEVVYILPTQTMQHIDWNQQGVLDVFYEPR
jgi:hypothetical protein